MSVDQRGNLSGSRVPAGQGSDITATALRPIAITLVAATAGCSRSPSQNILGSFFPSWLLCLLVGAIAAFVIRGLLIAIGLGEAVVAPFLAYPAMALAVTFAVWLIWFGN